MSRINNIRTNLIFNIVKFTSRVILSFILRTVLIYIMGIEYLGLNGLFSNIFTFLNLTELGIGTAIVFSMYKPIAENDTEKVKALQNLYKKFYLIICIVVICLGLILLPFLKYLIKGEVKANVNIYILYVMYLANSVIGYLFAHKGALLFVHERNDVENKIETICLFGVTLLQVISIFLFKNYYVFFSLTILFTLVRGVLVTIWANKLFPEIRGKSESLDKETKKQVFKNISAMSLHKVAQAIVFSTDNILISAILGLIVLGTYSNYYFIITGLTTFFSLVSNALIASVGNLVASKDKDYVYEKFKLINFMFDYLCAFCTICLFVLFQPFMKIWMRLEGNYLLDSASMTLLCLSFYFSSMRTGIWIFRNATGLFWPDRWATLVESIINLVASIILAKFMGLSGIILGTILSTLLVPMWVKPYIVHKYYFKKGLKIYFIKYLVNFIVMVLGGVICYFVCNLIPDGGTLLFIAKLVTCVVLSNVILVLVYFKSEEFKGLYETGKEFISFRKVKS